MIARAGYVRDDDGRYVHARYDDRACQWRSDDLPARLAGSGYQYSYAGSLHALRRLGISSYSRRAVLTVIRKQED